jgi:hypothetical protein
MKTETEMGDKPGDTRVTRRGTRQDGKDPPIAIARGAWLCYPKLQTSTSKSKKTIFCCHKPPVCGTLSTWKLTHPCVSA